MSIMVANVHKQSENASRFEVPLSSYNHFLKRENPNSEVQWSVYFTSADNESIRRVYSTIYLLL